MNQQNINNLQPEQPEKQRHRVAALATAIAIGAGALAGCASSEVEARPNIVQSSTEASPEESETQNITIKEAREALREFTVEPSASLYEYSDSTDLETAKSDAESYLAAKQSRLAIVDYTDLSKRQLSEYGQTLESRISHATNDSFEIKVDVYPASKIARKLNSQVNQDGLFDPYNDKSYAAVIADATMPDINGYESVIALTDNIIDPESGIGGDAVTLSTGRYSDMVNFKDHYEPTINNDANGVASDELPQYNSVDIALHEWLHSVPKLQHAKIIATPMGDLSTAFPLSPDQAQIVDLQSFLDQATAFEFGDENILGQTTFFDEPPALNTAQLYITEAAERMLGKPCLIEDTVLNEAGTVKYASNSAENQIAVLELLDTISVDGDSDQGINMIDKLAFSPTYDGEKWLIDINGLTIDNGTAKFMTMELSNSESGSIGQRSIELPSGETVSLVVNKDQTLQIAITNS